MTRPFYADYVNRMLRFYARKIHSGEVLRMKMENNVDKKNWNCVVRVLDKLPERDKDVIIEVYRGGLHYLPTYIEYKTLYVADLSQLEVLLILLVIHR